MEELKELCGLFINSADIKEILDDEVYRKKYSKINLRKLVLILEKYKNDKFSANTSVGNPEIDEIIKNMQKVRKSDA